MPISRFYLLWVFPHGQLYFNVADLQHVAGQVPMDATYFIY